MATKKRGGEYSRTYTVTGGIDLGDAASTRKDGFPHLLNMYRNYAGDPTSVVTFPGYRRLYRFGGEVHGIYDLPYGTEEGLVVYAGDALYRFPYRLRDSLSELRPFYTGLSGKTQTAFLHGGCLYLGDGKDIYRISTEGEVSSVTETPYIPTVALDGTPYEQRNLLTPLVRERRHIGDASPYAVESDGFVFAKNEDGVSATLADYTGDGAYLTVPATVTLSGEELTVTAIGNDAFANASFVGITLPESLTEIGETAFRNCKNLRSVTLPTGLASVGDLAFLGCTALSYVYIGAGIEKFGAAPFADCTALREFGTSLTAEELLKCIEETAADYSPASFSEALSLATVHYEAAPRHFIAGGVYRIPLSSEIVSYQSVTLDGRAILYRKTPFVLPDATELVDFASMQTALQNASVPLLSFAVEDCGFTVSGAADITGTLRLNEVVLSRGSYAFSGAPLLSSGYGLSVTLTEKSGEKTVYRHTGEDIFFTVEEDGCTAVIDFFFEENAQFSGVSFYPSVRAAEGTVSVSGETDKGGCVTALRLSASDERLVKGKTLTVLGRTDEKSGVFYRETGLPLNKKTLLDCSLSAVYDGRVFLSGNPQNPAVVLYPARTAEGNIDISYFGAYNYFTDGSEKAKNAALVGTAGGLFVLKGELDGIGSVYCHIGADTEEDLVPRVYPVAASLDGDAVTGAAASFMGEAVFLSKRGLLSVGRESLEKERRLYNVSKRVSSLLMSVDGKKSAMTVSGGYLVISDGEGKVLLADGRNRDARGYEFYPLSPVGSYADDGDAYEYASSLPDGLSGYTLSDTPRCLSRGKVLSENGVYYTEEEGKRVLLICRGEKTGGEFSPASVFATVSDTVFFGTADGSLSVFNTDLCGEDGFYPPEAYGFAGHRYCSALALPADDLGVLQYTKRTVPHSSVLKTKDFRGGRLHILVRHDTEPFSETACLFGGEADFGETDFTAFSFGKHTESVFPFREKFSAYAEKQYYLYTEDYRARFGLTALSFRYRIGGRIR